MSKFGRLEAQITVPAGGYAVSATNGGGGPTTVTIPAGTYYPNDLLTTFAAQLDASRPTGWTVTVADGEGATGFVTINCSSTPWSITWTSTTLRSILGFTANIVAVSTAQTGTSILDGMWLPDCPMLRLDTSDGATVIRSDARYSVSPTGKVFALVGNVHYRYPPLRWSHLSRSRAVDSANRNSWTRWVQRTHLGTLEYFPPGPPVRVYTDATADTLLDAYYFAGLADTSQVRPAESGWDGLWSVETPELILVI
jgi:hypothetical protein